MTATRAVRVPVGADGRPAGRDQLLVTELSEYQNAVVRSSALDSVTTELIRLRCARQHDCRICQTLRLTDAADDGLTTSMIDAIDFYEQSDLSDRHKVALRIVDAFIWQPAGIDDELVRQARQAFTVDELAEILVDITKWSTQKIHVTLGTDGAEGVAVNADGVSYFTFTSDGRPVR